MNILFIGVYFLAFCLHLHKVRSQEESGSGSICSCDNCVPNTDEDGKCDCDDGYIWKEDSNECVIDNGGSTSSTLSPGAIAGIAVGCAVGAFLILLGMYLYLTQTNKTKTNLWDVQASHYENIEAKRPTSLNNSEKDEDEGVKNDVFEDESKTTTF